MAKRGPSLLDLLRGRRSPPGEALGVDPKHAPRVPGSNVSQDDVTVGPGMGAPSSKGRASILTSFQKPFTWVISALGLDSPSPPNALELSRILPTLDMIQAGWPFAKIGIFLATTPAASGASVYGVIQGAAGIPGYAILNPFVVDPLATFRVMGFSVIHAGGAAAAQAAIFLGSQRNANLAGGTGNSTFLASTFVLNGGGRASMMGTPSAAGTEPVGFGVTMPVWLPYPLDFFYSFPATAGGEIWTALTILAQLPAGVAVPS